ncbi:MAG TPA: tetratricopeptide repeat protein [Verrucomicrobiales bacterium]|nr:tetratricopeptide repeat protein [Verrucomicrobiales bacterium]
MSTRLRPVCAVLALSLLSAAVAQEPNDKARRYFDTLLKRPAPGAVFDRFYNAWLDTGTLEEMETFLLRSADAPGNESAARLLLAFYYAKQNEHAKAAAEFARALEKNPNSPDGWHQKALAESRLLDYSAALASVEKALAANPAKVLQSQLRQFKGRLLARDGRLTDALETWKKLLADSPGDTALQEDIIELQTAEGLNVEALATAESLLAQTKDPYQKVQRRMRVGDLHARMGHRDDAVAAYTQCLDDTGADSWLEKETLAQIEQVFRRDDAVEALNAHFSALVKKYPQRLSLHRRYARLLAERGDTDGAIDAFRNILKLAPGDRTVHEDYISLLSQTKKREEAVAQLEELIRLYPAEAELAARLAELQFEAGRPAEAKAAVESFLTKSGPSEPPFLRAAALLERFKQVEPSLALYRRTSETFPSSESAQDAFALALHRHGHKPEAIAAWKKMASGADKTRLSAVARSAASREEHALAWELLSARAAEFQDDPVFLTQLCDLALRLDKFKEALPHARRLVSLAKDASAMETALTIAVTIADKAQQSGALLQELSAAASPQDRCLLAELLEKSGKRPEAEAALATVTAEAPELAAALRVRLFNARGDVLGAAAAMQALVESAGGQKAAHVQRLVELFIRAGKPNEALHWITVWKKLSPGAVTPWQREAAIHMTAGRTADALKTLRQASTLFEDNADLRTALAAAYRDDEKYPEALRIYTALYDDAKDIPARLRLTIELARTAVVAGKLEDLIESFEERRRTNRASVVPLLSLAEIHRFTENYEARRTVLLEAARVAPDNKDLQLEIVRAAESEGDWDHALQVLRDLSAKDPSGVTSAKLATMLYDSGREPEALKIMSGLAASGKADPRDLEAMASTLATAQSWTECAEFLKPVLTQFPADYRLAYLYAVALEESGETAPALDAFRSVAAMKVELPGGPVKPPQGTPGSAQSSRAVKLANKISGVTSRNQTLFQRLAPEIEEFEKLSGNLPLAYGYRSVRGTEYRGLSAPSPAVAVQLPRSVEFAPVIALPHLKELSAGIAGARTNLLAAFVSAGLRDAAVFWEMAPGPGEPFDGSAETQYHKFPDNVTLQLSLALGVCIKRLDLPPATVAALIDGLRVPRPAVSFLLALVQSEGAEQPALDAARNLADMAARDAAAGFALLHYLGERLVFKGAKRTGTQPSLSIDSRLAEALLPWLTKSYWAADPSDPSRPMLFHFLARRCFETKDTPGLIKLLEAEMTARSVAAAASAPVPSQGSSSRRDRTAVRPIGFPKTGEDFPDTVLAALTLAYDDAPAEWLTVLSKEALLPFLPTIKNPVLRMVLAATTKDGDLIKDCIPALDAIPRPSSAAVMLLAGWREKQGDFEEAAQVLKRAGQLTSSDRQRLDLALLYWANSRLEKMATDDLVQPLLKDAREAALRFRQVPGADAFLIAQYMRSLGMTKEADSLTVSARRAAPRPPSQGSRIASVTSRGYQPQRSQKDRVEDLLNAGRRSEALQFAHRELRDWTRTILTESRNSNPPPSTESWRERMTSLGIKDDILKLADPGPGAEATALAAWGVAQQILLGPEVAVEFYRKALESRPRSQEFFSLGIRAAMKTSPQDAVGIIRAADVAVLARAGVVLKVFSFNALATMDRIALLEGMGQRLESLDAATLQKADLHWASQWLNQFTFSGLSEDEQKYGNLHGLAPRTKDGRESAEAVPVRARWYAATKKAGLFLMKNNELAAEAFAAFIEIRDRFEPAADRAATDRLAQEVIDLRVAWKKNNRSATERVFYWLPTTDRGRDTRLSPGEWLLQSAVIQGSPDAVNRDLLPKLKDAGAAAEASLLQRAADLHFCDVADFHAAVRTAVSGAANTIDACRFLDKAIAAMMDRKISADFSEPLLRMVTSEGAAGLERFTRPVQRYALHLRRAKGFADTDAFYAKLTNIFLGPDEKRKSLIASSFNTGKDTRAPLNDRIHAWLRLTGELSQIPELSFNMLRALEREFLIHCGAREDTLDEHSDDGGILTHDEFYSKPVEEIMPAFRGSPALAEAAEFDLPIAEGRAGTPVPGGILRSLRTKGIVEKMSAAFAAEPQTFGTAFLRAALSDSPADAILTLVGERLDSLEKLPAEQQKRLARICRTLARNPKSTSDPVVKALAWLERQS